MIIEKIEVAAGFSLRKLIKGAKLEGCGYLSILNFHTTGDNIKLLH